MAQIIFWIIIGITVFDFVFEKILNFVNFKYSKKPLPSVVSTIYDTKKYAKWRNYENTNYKFSHLLSSISFVLILLMFFLEGFAFVDKIAMQISTNPILNALIFFAILGIVTDFISTPFNLYDTFVIEEKFGFNKTTLKTFIADKLKSLLLSVIIGGGLMSLIIYIYYLTPENFWILAWLIISFFMCFYGRILFYYYCSSF